MSKDDIVSKLQQREERRRNSVVASMVGAPAMQPASEEEQRGYADVQPGSVVIPSDREARTRRKQILLQPSIHDQAEKKCRKLDISMNEVINQLLRSWVKE